MVIEKVKELYRLPSEGGYSNANIIAFLILLVIGAIFWKQINNIINTATKTIGEGAETAKGAVS